MIKGYLGDVIKMLGYDKAKHFYLFDDIPFCRCSAHIRNVLKVVRPVAVYMVDYNPFICFFDIKEHRNIHELCWKIWNAQLEIAMCISDTTVEIYYGKSLKLKDMCPQKLEELELSESAQMPFSYFEIKTGAFWKKYQHYFEKRFTLNDILLDNIRFVTDKLKLQYDMPYATKFVLRMIFIRYMIDRGVEIGYAGFSDDIESSRERLIELCSDKKSLYTFFQYLKQKFNGNIFDAACEKEEEETDDEALEWMGRFLAGKEIMENGQLAFFDLYDFNIIPVELISNIYEIVLGKAARKEDKAFYTPYYLADYIVRKECEGDSEPGKVLDPACGSGIFLVLYYRQLVERNKIKGCIEDEKLIELMKDHIYGVDKNPEAVSVAVFSLYLAILEYRDPKSIKNFQLPSLVGSNLICADFFDDESLWELRSNKYSLIIGNPPWGRMKEGGRHIKYCQQQNLPQQNEEISRSFLYKVRDYSSASTRCCLILPSKLFYNQQNPAKECRKYLLNNIKIDSIMEMSSVVRQLFENALSPAAVLSFHYQQQLNPDEALMKHISLKPTEFFHLFHMLIIEKADVKYIKQSVLLKYDWLWKTLVYGNTGDFENILKLKNNYITLGNKMKEMEPDLINFTGVQYNDGTEDATNLLGRPMLKPRSSVEHFYIDLSEDNFTPFSKKRIHRTRDIRLYEAPYCLLTKGVDPRNYRMRAVCCEDKDFVFPETIYGIKGKEEQVDFLYGLAGLLNSSLYAYYNFMTGASTGIDRRQRFVKDILQFPYPKKNIEAIIRCSRELHQLKRQVFVTEDELDDKMKELDKNVLEAFDMKDNVYVQYALDVMIPMITAGSSFNTICGSMNPEDYISYAEIFYGYFSEVFESEGKFVQIEIYPDVEGSLTAFTLRLVREKPKQTIKLLQISMLPDVLNFVYQAYNDIFYNRRDHYHFEENSFMILKAATRKNWHPANAYMDLAEITERIIND